MKQNCSKKNRGIGAIWTGNQTSAGQFSATTRRQLALTSISFLVFLAFSLITTPLSEVQAADGLAVNSNARVAGTDGDGVNLREEANSKANILKLVSENELVIIKGSTTKDKQGNSFYKVNYEGKTGYIMSQYLYPAGKPAPNAPKFAVGSLLKITATDGDGVNMRQQANSGSSVLNVLDEEEVVTVLGGPFADSKGNNFYRVDYKGQTGFVSMTFLTTAPKNAAASGSNGGNMRVTNTDGDPVRFRSGPSRGSETNGYVHEGDIVKILSNVVKDDDGNKWYRIEQNGKVGYVDATFLSKNTTTAVTPPRVVNAPAPKPTPVPKPQVAAPPSNGSLGERVVTYARQFTGWRYVWGGSGPDDGGFDCSGFVVHVFGKFGYSLPHFTGDLANVGKFVPADSLQPGDILIWSNTYMPGPSHTGVYIGGGKFIHAENEYTGVTIDNLSNPYYASRYTSARRIGA